MQLPVHQIGGGKRSPIYAVVPELNFWMFTAGGTHALNQEAALQRRKPTSPCEGDERNNGLTAKLHELAQAVAENSARYSHQAQVLGGRVVALRSRIAARGKNA